jgi:transposase
MSVQVEPLPVLPEDTARVARAAFKRKGSIYLTIGDQLSALFDEVDFAQLYAADGKPAISPNLLALVSVFQFMENLPDREAADAVRSRIDWKYALHLPLADTGFDDSVLSEFRTRLARYALAQTMFEQVLMRLQGLGLLKKGGKQRTDATYVLAATQLLNRVQFVAETMRLALEALAEHRPAWLRGIALPHWYERYSLVLTGFRLPRTKEQQEALALDIGRDGFHLLKMLMGAEAPQQARQLPAIQTLQVVWQQQFEEQAGGLRWRAKADKPPAAEQIVTPHDPEARFTIHQAHGWEGYQTHWTETCDAERPHLITHVATPAATTNDVQLVPLIHTALAKLELLPSEHLVDTGYLSADNIVDSQTHYGVRLVGPVGPGGNWQAGVADGITLDQFEFNWRQQIATCPQGHQSQHWRSYKDAHGESWTKIGFAKATCDTCSHRQSCTKSTRHGRQLRLGPHYELMRELRSYQSTEAFRTEYAARAGIEGTVSAAVRAHGARRSRYLGQAKTATQALLTAIAINLRRSALWLLGERPGCSRPPSLTCLAPA